MKVSLDEVNEERVAKEKKKHYAKLNERNYTINFGSGDRVSVAKEAVKALKKFVGLKSVGVTVILAVQFCLLNENSMEFTKYVNSRRREFTKTRK